MKIGLENCTELFAKLKFEKERLDSNWNEYDFFNFMVTAWHLQNDWLKNDRDNRPELAMRKINDSPVQMKEIMNIARDIANGSKHFRLDQPSEKKKVVNEVHPPEIRDWHSYFFGAKHAVSTNEAYYSVADLSGLIMRYFIWVFDDLQPAHLPNGIQKQLDYCNLGERE